MKTRQYTVRELKNIVKESAQEFKPKFGTNVQDDNKKINDKAYKEMAQATKDYDGGARNESKKKPVTPKDDNRGMENLEYNNMTDEFKNKVKSQMKGYTSSDAEKAHKNDPYGNAEFNGIEGLDDKAKEIKKGRDTAKEIGLTSREIDKKDFENQKKTVYHEGKMPRLKVKSTAFVSEGHMLSKVPDDYKVDGKKFSFRDKNDDEYIVEWSEKPKVTHVTKINEQKNRIMELFNYKRKDSNTTLSGRLTEDKKVEDMMDKARKLMK